MRMFALAVAASAVAMCAASALAAGAPLNRAWVSGHGVDQAGCGAPIAPCRSLQYAHDNAVVAGGEIDILDPAGYGSLTITKSISVVNDGVGTAGVQAASGAAITINAGPNDAIYLKGLNIDGVLYGGTNGVVLNSGRYLTIDGCVVRHFNSIGIDVEPTTGLLRLMVLNTIIADNAKQGISVVPPSGNAIIEGTIDRDAVLDNGYEGVDVYGAETSGSIKLSVSNTVANHNSVGVLVQSPSANSVVDVDNSEMNQNGDGATIIAKAVLHLSRSTLNQNGSYGANNETTAGGAFYSTGDNHLEGNGTQAIIGVAPTIEPLQ